MCKHTLIPLIIGNFSDIKMLFVTEVQTAHLRFTKKIVLYCQIHHSILKFFYLRNLSTLGSAYDLYHACGALQISDMNI